jgi:hypothetical protein
MQNLDFFAAQAAPEILKITDSKQENRKEPLINQALGILAEQGPFAMMLWAKTNYSGKTNSKKIGDTLLDTLAPLIKDVGLADFGQEDFDTWLQKFNETICNSFVNLMMTRQLFERVLIYARHYAKAEVKGD